ncbi:MAG: CAP domain-containing protein [Acidobacteria bacterium]|nr:CAP domain-containing protein [Acidobacteriota bacterium]
MLRTWIVVLALATIGWAQNAAPAEEHAVASGATKSTKPTPKLLSAALPSITEDSAAESELLALANQSRQNAGLPPLRMNQDLMDAARAHARLMIQQRQLSHQFDGEPNLLKRLHATGVPLNSVGENVAYNASAEKAFNSFMNSPPHRSNLLDPDFNAVAFVAIWSDGQLYVVQDFVRQIPDITPVSSRK